MNTPDRMVAAREEPETNERMVLILAKATGPRRRELDEKLGRLATSKAALPIVLFGEIDLGVLVSLPHPCLRGFWQADEVLPLLEELQRDRQADYYVVRSRALDIGDTALLDGFRGDQRPWALVLLTQSMTEVPQKPQWLEVESGLERLRIPLEGFYQELQLLRGSRGIESLFLWVIEHLRCAGASTFTSLGYHWETVARDGIEVAERQLAQLHFHARSSEMSSETLNRLIQELGMPARAVRFTPGRRDIVSEPFQADPLLFLRRLWRSESVGELGLGASVTNTETVLSIGADDVFRRSPWLGGKTPVSPFQAGDVIGGARIDDSTILETLRAIAREAYQRTCECIVREEIPNSATPTVRLAPTLWEVLTVYPHGKGTNLDVTIQVEPATAFSESAEFLVRYEAIQHGFWTSLSVEGFRKQKYKTLNRKEFGWFNRGCERLSETIARYVATVTVFPAGSTPFSFAEFSKAIWQDDGSGEDQIDVPSRFKRYIGALLLVRVEQKLRAEPDAARDLSGLMLTTAHEIQTEARENASGDSTYHCCPKVMREVLSGDANQMIRELVLSADVDERAEIARVAALLLDMAWKHAIAVVCELRGGSSPFPVRITTDEEVAQQCSAESLSGAALADAASPLEYCREVVLQLFPGLADLLPPAGWRALPHTRSTLPEMTIIQSALAAQMRYPTLADLLDNEEDRRALLSPVETGNLSSSKGYDIVAVAAWAGFAADLSGSAEDCAVLRLVEALLLAWVFYSERDREFVTRLFSATSREFPRCGWACSEAFWSSTPQSDIGAAQVCIRGAELLFKLPGGMEDNEFDCWRHGDATRILEESPSRRVQAMAEYANWWDPQRLSVAKRSRGDKKASCGEEPFELTLDTVLALGREHVTLKTLVGRVFGVIETITAFGNGSHAPYLLSFNLDPSLLDSERVSDGLWTRFQIGTLITNVIIEVGRLKAQPIVEILEGYPKRKNGNNDVEVWARLYRTRLEPVIENAWIAIDDQFGAYTDSSRLTTIKQAVGDRLKMVKIDLKVSRICGNSREHADFLAGIARHIEMCTKDENIQFVYEGLGEKMWDIKVFECFGKALRQRAMAQGSDTKIYHKCAKCSVRPPAPN